MLTLASLAASGSQPSVLLDGAHRLAVLRRPTATSTADPQPIKLHLPPRLPAPPHRRVEAQEGWRESVA